MAETEKTNKKKSKKSYTAGIIVGIVFLLILVAVVKEYIQTGSGDSLEKSLTEASSEMNKTTPINVDSVTALTTTTVIGKEMNYNYKYTGDVILTQAVIDSSLKASVINGVCTNSDTKSLIDFGAGMIYNYYDSTGKYAGKISVHVSDCK